MEKTFDTKFGEVTLRGAMLDTNGTDLVEGVEIKIDGVLEGEVLGRTFGSVEDLTIKEVEQLVTENCEV